MPLKEKLIAVGVEKLADILLNLYESNEDMQKHLDIVFAGLEEDPKKITNMIRKEILSLKRSTKFIDYYEADSLVDHLDKLRLYIINDLHVKASNIAFELMLEFINLHEPTLNRVDDRNGNIGGIFISACENLGKISESIEKPLSEIVDFVFLNFMNNNFGIYDEIILNFKNSLKSEGIKLLKDRLEKSLNPKNKITVKLGLKAVADCKKDVDDYIYACSFVGEPSDHDHLEIAERLIEHLRGEEALEWLGRMNITHHHSWQPERYKLKIQALELSGYYEKAQAERLSWFAESLSAEVYVQILKQAQPDFKERFRIESIKRAFGFSEPHVAISFLIQLQEVKEGAKFVRSRHHELCGRQYYTLRPIADLLQDVDPIAATLLYRKMIQPILEAAKSKYYNYAAKDLVICGLLSSRINEWGSLEDHNNYMKLLQEKHKRKARFWTEYGIVEALLSKSKPCKESPCTAVG